MSSKRSLQEKWESFKFNHIGFKYFVGYTVAITMIIFSAVIFCFGFATFLSPNVAVTSTNQYMNAFVSGGASGIGQVFEKLVCIILKKDSVVLFGTIRLYSIFYFAVNIPILILAFKGIGIRFGILTVINVAITAICSSIFSTNEKCVEFLSKIAVFVGEYGGGMLGRAIFAGICTGLSSAVAFKCEASAGGIDVISYYVSIKKSTLAGKYGVILNVFIILSFSILNVVQDSSQWLVSLSCVLYGAIYMFTVMLVIDSINVRNKKVQLQIITTNADLPNYLLAHVPHGATIINGKGAYSGQDRLVIFMVVQSVEVKKVIRLIKAADKDSFVNVTSLQQVYGRFFIRPIR